MPYAVVMNLRPSAVLTALAVTVILAGCSSSGTSSAPSSSSSEGSSITSSSSPSATKSAAPDGWKSLDFNNFYAAIDSNGKLVAAYITPTGHYCVSNFLPDASLTNPADASTVQDVSALWHDLAGSRSSGWMTTGEGCGYNGAAAATFDDSGKMVEHNHLSNGTTDTYTRQLTITASAFELVTQVSSTGVTSELDFVAYKIPA
jgi:hypothetical protein